MTDTGVQAAGGRPSGGTGLSTRQVRLRSLMQTIGMLPVLLLMCLAFHWLSGGHFLTARNLSIVAQQASVNTVLAAGMTFVILTGGIDLSVGSMLAISAVVGLQVSLTPLWILAIPAALGTGLLFGLVNGGLVAYGKLPPFIVTLGTLTAVRGVARLAGNDGTVFNENLQYAAIGDGTLFGVPWLVIIALLVIVGSWIILRRTVLGMRIYAVGGNPAAARLSGIKVAGILLFAYAMSGLLAGLGGVMTSARLYAANGLQLGISYELDAIAAVILGGTSFVGGIGSIWGTLIGALIIAALTNGLILLGVSDIWQFIIKGLVIIGAVALDRLRTGGGVRT